MKLMPGQPRKPEPRGIVMLLALLVLSAITAVAIGMATIIMKDVKTATNVDSSMKAYYAAETGIENGLYEVMLARSAGAESLADLIDSLKDLGGSQEANQARWTLGPTSSSESYALTYLRKNQTVVLDLYDADHPSYGDFRCFLVEALDSHPESSPAWLEISYTLWKYNAGTSTIEWEVENPNVTKRLRSIDETRPGAPASFLVELNQNYRVRVKALYDDLKNVKITAYGPDADGGCTPAASNQKDIPNRVLLQSNGESADNIIALTASVPWQVPAGGIFDFVLFSEQTLDKRM